MKTDERIIKLLAEAPGEPVSGEELARRLDMSRSAVWKRIRNLRELGFDISGGTAKGYTLQGIEDLIRPEYISRKLKTRLVGKNIVYKPVTGSTNRDAFELADEGAPEGTCVIADVQTKGRGRMGRSWAAPAASAVLTSMIFRPELSPQTATLLTLVAGIAAANAVRRVTDLEPWIKWPNDLKIGDKKLAGILTEMHAEMDRVHYVVVGMGINVNISLKSFPKEIKKLATSLSIETGRIVNRNQLIATLYYEMESAYRRLIERGPKAVIEQWELIAGIRGKRVRATMIDGKTVEGVAVGLGPDGSLHIEDDIGRERQITAGDVEVASRL